MKAIPKNKAYAFWGYDFFPFILGGRVTQIRRKRKNEPHDTVWTK